MKLKLWFIGLTLSLLATACGEDENRVLSSEEATNTINSALETHGHALRSALAFSDEGFFQQLAQALDNEWCEAGPGTVTFDFAERFGDITELEQGAIQLENAEQVSDTEVRWTVTPEYHCRFYNTPSSYYDDCASELAQNPLVWAATSQTEGTVHVELLSGAGKHRVLAIDFGENEISGEINIGAIVKAEQEYIHVVDDSPEPAPSVGRGKIAFNIIRIDAGVYTMTVDIASDIEVIVPGEGLPDTEFRLAKAVPALHLEVSEADKLVRVTSSLNALELITPGECDAAQTDCSSAKAIAVNMAGLSGTLELDGTDQLLRFTDIAIANQNATVSYGEDPIVDVAWNADNEGRFSGSLQMVDEGLKLSLEPKLDLSAAVGLSDMAGEDAPEWLQDQLFEVMIGGPPKAELIMPKEDGCISFNSVPQIKVLSGMIDITETNHVSEETYTLQIASDMCMVGVEEADPAFLFSNFEQNTCN